MTGSGFRQVATAASAEIARAVSALEEAEAERLEEAIAAAGAVFVTGEGRSGLIARCFAMRLMHLGRRAYVVGETIAPAAGKGDLLIAVSRSGESRVTCTHAQTARSLGVTVAAITASPRSPLLELADLSLAICDQSEQYGGSLFEQTTLVALDALAALLQLRLSQLPSDLEARHANLE